jgi:hypothetical protein
MSVFFRRQKRKNNRSLASNFLIKQLGWTGKAGGAGKQRRDPERRPICKANGGAERDRTDDLKLAKLALSQLSYSPVVRMACQPKLAAVSSTFANWLRRTTIAPRSASEGWWARVELNHRPHAYQACALTT